MQNVSPCNLCNLHFVQTDVVYLSIMSLTVSIVSFHSYVRGPAHSENALFPFLLRAYREQCAYLCVKASHNTTYVFQQNIHSFPVLLNFHFFFFNFIPTFQITRIKNIQLFPNWPSSAHQSKNIITERVNLDNLSEKYPSNCLS